MLITQKNPEFLQRTSVVLVCILALLLVMPSLISGVLICLALYATRGPRESLQALTVMFIVLNLNPGLFPIWGRGASLRWLVLFSAFGRVIWDGLMNQRAWPIRVLKPFGVYVFCMGILSVVASRLPDISLFKVFAFSVGVVTVLTSFYRTRHLGLYWFSWFFTVFLVIVGLSLPLYLSSTGYYTNGRGFQGILIHPQTYGTIAAPMLVWLIASWFFRGQLSVAIQFSIALGLLAVITSQARTSMLMFLGGFVVAFGFYHLRNSGRKVFVMPRIPLAVKLMGIVTLILMITWEGDRVKEAVSSFVYKKVGDVQSASFDVRATKMQKQLENFRNMPLSGIGFGMPTSSEDWVSVSRGFLGLPTGFSIEKGFLPSAILEETGIIGAVLVMVFVFSLIRFAFRIGEEPELAMLLAALLVNTGEAVFFSFGAMGLYFWLLIGVVFQKTESGSTPEVRSNVRTVISNA